jgi:hypothetical protein
MPDTADSGLIRQTNRFRANEHGSAQIVDGRSRRYNAYHGHAPDACVPQPSEQQEVCDKPQVGFCLSSTCGEPEEISNVAFGVLIVGH